MNKTIARFCRNESGSMAILGASILSVMVVGAGAAIDLSRISSAKTELMQITRFSCESAAVAMASSQSQQEARTVAGKLAQNSITESILLNEGTAVRITIPNGGAEVDVQGTGNVKLAFGGLLGDDLGQISAQTTCPITSAPINVDDPVVGCAGDAIIVTNATRFSADGDTAEQLTSSRTISIAIVDRDDNLLDRVIVGDDGQPSFARTGMSRSDSVIIQPIVSGAAAPVVCIPTAPPPTTVANPGNPGGGSGSGACLTGNISGAAAGRELSFATDGTYQAFITDGSGEVAVDNGAGSTATSSASLDGPGLATGSASVGDGSSSSCAEIVTENARGVAVATAQGETTHTSTDITETSDENGTTVRGVITGYANGNPNANRNGNNRDRGGNGNGNGRGRQ